jgi:nickel-dependent lactate racemase
MQAEGGGVRLAHGANGPLLDSSNGNAAPLDPAAAVIAALAEPLEFPPLSAGIVPGDRIAIAVDDAAPCIASIVRGAVQALQNAGVDPEEISIITSDAQTSDLCREELTCIEPGPRFVVHDPADDKNLCLVGATRRGVPLLVNRTIFDADLVLPIGCARYGRESAYDSLFPRFSDAATVQKYRTPAQLDAFAPRNGKRNEVDEAGWMIGVPMTVQVVPGHSETVAHVVAGEPQAVARRCDELCRQQWLLHSPQRVGLVVATITGAAQSQTWVNVGRALSAAESVLDDGGAVAICSNLVQPTGHSLGRLIGSPDLDAAARKIFHDHDPDTWPAWQVARALQRGPVYFLSRLSSETVEDLGLAPVESVDELVRLAHRCESYLLVEDAQHVVLSLDDV